MVGKVPAGEASTPMCRPVVSKLESIEDHGKLCIIHPIRVFFSGTNCDGLNFTYFVIPDVNLVI